MATPTKFFTEEQRARYRRVFDFLDRNKNGLLETEEIAAAAKVLGKGLNKEHIAKIMGQLDTSKTGSLSFDEFLQAMPGQNKPPAMEQSTEEYERRFREYDANSDGFVTADEAHAVLSKELGFTPERTHLQLTQFDMDDDGKLNYLEFVAFYTDICHKKTEIEGSYIDCDVDKKGYVSLADAQRVMCPLGLEENEKSSDDLSFDDCFQSVAPQDNPNAKPVSTEELERMFRGYDANSDGFVTADEAHAVLGKELGFTPERTHLQLTQFDLDDDDKLNYLEFIPFYTDICQKKNDITASFIECDVGKKGYVWLEDAQKLMCLIGLEENEITELFNKHSHREYGKLFLDEFFHFWSC